jgi:hypothetical protein
MNKKIKFNLSASVTLFLIICISCNQYIKPTPGKYKFLYSSKSREEYIKDSINLIKVLDKMIDQNVKPYDSKNEYDSLNTSVYLDSILYSPDKKGIVIFIITKTDKRKLGDQNDSTLSYFYNSNCLYGFKDYKNQDFKLFDYSSINFINFDSYKKAKEVLAEYCFGRRATDRPWNDREPRYNMDDIRFWNGDQFNSIRTDSNFIHIKDE